MFDRLLERRFDESVLYFYASEPKSLDRQRFFGLAVHTAFDIFSNALSWIGSDDDGDHAYLDDLVSIADFVITCGEEVASECSDKRAVSSWMDLIAKAKVVRGELMVRILGA